MDGVLLLAYGSCAPETRRMLETFVDADARLAQIVMERNVDA